MSVEAELIEEFERAAQLMEDWEGAAIELSCRADIHYGQTVLSRSAEYTGAGFTVRVTTNWDYPSDSECYTMAEVAAQYIREKAEEAERAS